MITTQLTNCNNYSGNIRQPVLMLKLLDMDTKKNRRLQLLLVIETLFGGKSGQCVDALEIKRPQLSRWITSNAEARQGISEDAARSIERKLGLPAGTLDAEPGIAPIERVMPQTPADLLVAWELLTHKQRHEYLAQIKATADENEDIRADAAKPKTEVRPPTKITDTHRPTDRRRGLSFYGGGIDRRKGQKDGSEK